MIDPPRRVSWSARERQYPWFRVYNTFPGHRKWRFLSAALKIHIAFVEATMVDIFAHANRNDGGKARGSLDGWSPEVCAATHDLEPADCARIYAKLEEIGDIEQEYLVNWDRRQPDRHDATAAARQQRVRERKKAKRLAAKAGIPLEVKPAVDAASPEKIAEIAASAEEQLMSQYWLTTTGEQIVAGRLGVRALNAKLTITGWLKECLKDARQLEMIIAAANQENLHGDAFRNIVGQKVMEFKRERTLGKPLPFEGRGVNGDVRFRAIKGGEGA